MKRIAILVCGLTVALLFLLPTCVSQQATGAPVPQENNYVIHDFHFKSGETLPVLRVHYMTLGKPVRDANGRVANAVLILHGTGGSGRQFLVPQFADVLFGPGQLLDTSRYFIILPDNIGHGKSTKPSDGLHARFPQYDYDDMVTAQHELLENGIGVNHLRLILGTSMGCMHAWVWGETYPDFVDALMPLACLPVPIAGRNRVWRKMLMDGIRQDPAWEKGEYVTQPADGIRNAADLLIVAGSAPQLMQKNLPTRDAADQYLDETMKRVSANLDANDILFAVNASRNYDPAPRLETIKARVVFVNSADDFINPPDLGIAEREIKRLSTGRFVLIPASDQTHGHGTHTWAAVWQQYLRDLLESSQ